MNINMTIIGQLIAFIIFVAICMKYIWPGLTAALAERQKKIADGLDAAERSERDLQKAQQSADATIEASKLQAAEIAEAVESGSSSTEEEVEA